MSVPFKTKVKEVGNDKVLMKNLGTSIIQVGD